ncbi:hypothetical protein CP965_12285 [Halarcobacter mediterraneus]|uniref:Phosphatidylserine decarboxylase n=1 Tax=Halarcobacter mediterraneus TaxID=2023153 RepID=A0A4Q1AVP3_9BACT|nr:phosphatidylserine decarboxylase [Halarcobacter mediterraneus]RXK11949.1 hypothetical protein CP965_12285 [Halarcobacter mediterraneus]
MLNKLIAKEGYKSIFSFLILTIVFLIIDCDFLSFVLFALTLWFIFIYRNNRFIKNYDEEDIVSPISGRISSIDIKKDKKLIYIDVSLFDNHILRAVKSGDFTVKTTRGTYTFLDSLKAKKLNEKIEIKYKDIKIELITSLFSNRTEIFESSALKGDKLAVFLNGQVVIELDNSKELLVNIGNKLHSGKTVIARNQ